MQLSTPSVTRTLPVGVLELTPLGVTVYVTGTAAP
jgi:hypothetical protein